MAKISPPDFFPEGDARTLTEASAIRANPNRLRDAKIAAKLMAEEQMVQAKAMRTLARTSKKKR